MRAQRVAQHVVRLALGGFMTFAGVSHLTFAREEFTAQVPEWVPVGEDLVVVGSGVAEVAQGVALLAFPRYRRYSGLALAAFYVAIFPGNIAQYTEGVDAFGLDTDAKRLGRLFFQPLLVAGALYAGGWFGNGEGESEGPGAGNRDRNGASDRDRDGGVR